MMVPRLKLRFAWDDCEASVPVGCCITNQGFDPIQGGSFARLVGGHGTTGFTQGDVIAMSDVRSALSNKVFIRHEVDE
jgi:hypothetical protein